MGYQINSLKLLLQKEKDLISQIEISRKELRNFRSFMEYYFIKEGWVPVEVGANLGDDGDYRKVLWFHPELSRKVRTNRYTFQNYHPSYGWYTRGNSYEGQDSFLKWVDTLTENLDYVKMDGSLDNLVYEIQN